MIEYLAYTAPLYVFRLTLIVVTCASVALGMAVRHRLAMEPGGVEEKALNVAQGAVSVLTALIIPFSFSFARSAYRRRVGPAGGRR